MARFIELPYGVYNEETKTTERTTSFVNLEQVTSITPIGEFMCKVTLRGADKNIVAYRKYDTLKAQICGQEHLTNTYPDEELKAAYEAIKMQNDKMTEKDLEKAIKDARKVFLEQAVEWLSTNPLTDNWISRFKKDLK